MIDRKELDELRRIVFRCNICVVDLDECIYPRFTQTTLGALVLARTLSPRKALLLPRLLTGAAYIMFMRFLQIFGYTPANIDLMRNFSRIMSGVPITLMEECASKLPSMGPQEWRSALAAISSLMPVYLVTFAIEPIARVYARTKGSHGRALFSGYRATPVEVRDDVFRGCLYKRDSFLPDAKAAELSRILAETGCEKPLVIGHGSDEAAMFSMANEIGGGSIAIQKEGCAKLEGVKRVASWNEISRTLGEYKAENRKQKTENRKRGRAGVGK